MRRRTQRRRRRRQRSASREAALRLLAQNGRRRVFSYARRRHVTARAARPGSLRRGQQAGGSPLRAAAVRPGLGAGRGNFRVQRRETRPPRSRLAARGGRTSLPPVALRHPYPPGFPQNVCGCPLGIRSSNKPQVIRMLQT